MKHLQKLKKMDDYCVYFRSRSSQHCLPCEEGQYGVKGLVTMPGYGFHAGILSGQNRAGATYILDNFAGQNRKRPV